MSLSRSRYTTNSTRAHQEGRGWTGYSDTIPNSSSSHGLRNKMPLVLPFEMVDNSRSLSKPLSGWFFVSGQSGQTFSSRIQAPSDLFYGHSYPSASDMGRFHSRWWIILLASVHPLWAGVFVSGQS